MTGSSLSSSSSEQTDVLQQENNSVQMQKPETDKEAAARQHEIERQMRATQRHILAENHCKRFRNGH